MNIEIKQPSGRGGARPGAGRKPGSATRRCSDCGDAKAAALARAVQDCQPLAFVLAMLSLAAPLDDIRRALGMSRSQFLALYASEIAARVSVLNSEHR